MKAPLRDEKRIDEEAAAWLEVLQRDDPGDREVFAAWAKESPRHVRAFLLMTALDVELDGVDAERKQTTQLERSPVIALGAYASEPAQVTPRKTLTRRSRWAALAAAVAAIAVIGSLAITLFSQRYSTSVGEQRTFQLTDGSMVYLNTDSKIAIDYSTHAREIRLLAGEALFKVARDGKRPFRVHTDDALIQVLGTQFNVRQDAHGTKIAVIEGKIKVADQETPLIAGEEATIPREAHTVTRGSADLARTLAWQQRRLIFRTDTLADIAAEFNRYNHSPKIEIEDEVLKTRRFSGVFDANDPESLAQVLEGSAELRIQRSEREIFIRRNHFNP